MLSKPGGNIVRETFGVLHRNVILSRVSSMSTAPVAIRKHNLIFGPDNLRDCIVFANMRLKIEASDLDQ